MADKKRRDLFNFFKDGGEKTVGTTLRGDMYRQNVWTFGRNPDCDFCVQRTENFEGALQGGAY